MARKPKPSAGQIAGECCATPPLALLAGGGDRAGEIEQHRWLWNSGEPLIYRFATSPSSWRGKPADEDAVRAAFKTWLDLGIGLDIAESSSSSDRVHIRIAFGRSAGTWSKIGTEAIGAGARTMNFARALADEEGRLIALHEVGHSLGFKHEHQNQTQGIRWADRAEVRAHYGARNNWPDTETDKQVLKPLPPEDFGYRPWDPDSIMNYRIPARLMLNRSKDVDPRGLSPGDIARALRFYPRVLRSAGWKVEPFRSQPLTQKSGEQAFFELRPAESRKYTMTTIGELDSKLTLYEKGPDGIERYLGTDQDGGLDSNAVIEARLHAGRRYLVRLRVLYNPSPGDGAFLFY